MHLEQISNSFHDHVKWDKTKQEVLAMVMKSNAGCLVSDSFTLNDNPFHHHDFLSLCDFHKIHRHSAFKEDVYYLFKDHWPMTELDDIATGRPFALSRLWMLPNFGYKMSRAEAEEFWKHIDDLTRDHDSLPLENLKIEAIGCIYDGNSILWTHPKAEKVDLFVENLKKLCVDLQIELKEV